jgi:hypothetical protein
MILELQYCIKLLGKLELLRIRNYETPNILIIFGETPRVEELFSVRPSGYFFFHLKCREGREERLRRNTYRVGKLVEEGDSR